MQLDIFYSYACCDTYLVFAWLKQVQQRGISLRLNWRPFAIQTGNDAYYWHHNWVDACSERRGFIAASAAIAQGDLAFYRFHNALMQAVHEQNLELGEEQTILHAASEAGLNLERFRADWHNSDLVKQAALSHRQGQERYSIFGTPTLVFPDNHALHLELNQIPVGEDAETLWQLIHTVALNQLVVKQIRRTT